MDELTTSNHKTKMRWMLAGDFQATICCCLPQVKRQPSSIKNATTCKPLLRLMRPIKNVVSMTQGQPHILFSFIFFRPVSQRQR